MTRMTRHAMCAAVALSAAAGAVCGFGGPGDDGIARPRAHQLSFTGGRTFHQTDNPVFDQRLIVVPNSSTRIMLWSERLADGRAQGYEAISLGGGELLGQVRERARQRIERMLDVVLRAEQPALFRGRREEEHRRARRRLQRLEGLGRLEERSDARGIVERAVKDRIGFALRVLPEVIPVRGVDENTIGERWVGTVDSSDDVARELLPLRALQGGAELRTQRDGPERTRARRLRLRA